MNWHEYTKNKADMYKIKNLWKNFILIFSHAGSNQIENCLLNPLRLILNIFGHKKYAFVVVHVLWLVYFLLVTLKISKVADKWRWPINDKPLSLSLPLSLPLPLSLSLSLSLSPSLALPLWLSLSGSLSLSLSLSLYLYLSISIYLSIYIYIYIYIYMCVIETEWEVKKIDKNVHDVLERGWG